MNYGLLGSQSCSRFSVLSLSVERSATVVVIVIGSFLWFKKDDYDYDHDNEIGFLTGFVFAP